MKKKFWIIAFFVLVVLLVYREYSREPIIVKVIETIEKDVKKEDIKNIDIKEPEITVSLISTNFNDLENWKNDNLDDGIEKAFIASCQKIKFEKNEFLSNSAIKIPTKEYQKICNDFIANPKEFKKFIENNFAPYLVLENGNEFGKFTSYYESRINASFTKSEKYKYPVYGKPKDLITVNLKDFDETLPSKILIGMTDKNNKLIKYYTRKEIHNKNINAPIILWADSHIDIYVMQIQGSAVAYLDDGKQVRIGYAENNGFPFKGIGSILLSKGLLKPGQSSMKNIKKWLKENDKLAIENMLENERYIFHRIIEADGPLGAHGVPLVAGRSMAVDRKYVPLGSLLWLETTGPSKEKIEKLMIAQDIGSAIKGPIRGDYFWGSGDDDILDLAGSMNSSGRYFMLIPKTVEVEENEQ